MIFCAGVCAAMSHVTSPETRFPEIKNKNTYDVIHTFKEVPIPPYPND